MTSQLSSAQRRLYGPVQSAELSIGEIRELLPPLVSAVRQASDPEPLYEAAAQGSFNALDRLSLHTTACLLRCALRRGLRRPFSSRRFLAAAERARWQAWMVHLVSPPPLWHELLCPWPDLLIPRGYLVRTSGVWTHKMGMAGYGWERLSRVTTAPLIISGRLPDRRELLDHLAVAWLDAAGRWQRVGITDRQLVAGDLLRLGQIHGAPVTEENCLQVESFLREFYRLNRSRLTILREARP